MKNVIKLIKKAKSIALFSHANPDPDTIGSTIGLYLALQKIGKEVDLYCDAVKNENYNFLNEYKLYNNEIDKSKAYDLYVAVDVASGSMLGGFEEFFCLQQNTLRFDHHANGSNYATTNYVQCESACAIAVFDLLNKMKIKIDENIATALYFAICGDTGIFRNNNTDSVTFDVCAKLLKCGAKMRTVYNEFFDKKTVPYIKLTSSILLEAETDDKNGFVIMTATKDDYKKYSAVETENVSNLPHSYLNAGYKIAVILKERDDGIHCSFRSKFEYDCSLIAEKFGGGGHKNAAGCSIEEPIEKAKELVRKEILNYFKGIGG